MALRMGSNLGILPFAMDLGRGLGKQPLLARAAGTDDYAFYKTPKPGGDHAGHDGGVKGSQPLSGKGNGSPGQSRHTVDHSQQPKTATADLSRADFRNRHPAPSDMGPTLAGRANSSSNSEGKNFFPPAIPGNQRRGREGWDLVPSFRPAQDHFPSQLGSAETGHNCQLHHRSSSSACPVKKTTSRLQRQGHRDSKAVHPAGRSPSR